MDKVQASVITICILAILGFVAFGIKSCSEIKMKCIERAENIRDCERISG